MKHLVHLGAEKQFFFFTHREETRHILSLCHVVEERKTEMRFCDFTFYIALYHVVCFERNLWQRRCCNPLQICKILVLIGPSPKFSGYQFRTLSIFAFLFQKFLVAETFIRTFSAVLYSLRTASSQLSTVFLHSSGNNHLKNL